MVQRCLLIFLICIWINTRGITQTIDEKAIRPISYTHEFQDKDFEDIIKIAGKAKIIGLSEATHGMNEPLNFRNALIKSLVRKKLIDVVALENGTIEGKQLYDYVEDDRGKDDLNQVLKNGFSWSFYIIPQNEELVVWLKKYNADKDNLHKVKLYGFDMPGSPGNPNVSRKMDTAFAYALDYLRTVDPTSYDYFKQRLEPLFPYLTINFDDPLNKDKQFSQLEDTKRLQLSAASAELIKHFQTHQISYSKLSTKEKFDWGNLAALNGQQILNWLNYIPFGYVPSSDNKTLVNSDLFHLIFNYRDHAMSDNLNWIIEREPGARVFVFASTNHLLKKPISLTGESRVVRQKQVAGNYLNAKYGDQYFLIGNIASNNEMGDSSIENFFQRTSIDHYYMQLNSLKLSSSDDWKKYYYQDSETRLDLFSSFDIILFDKIQTNITFRE